MWWILAGCPHPVHALTDRPEPPACGVARLRGSPEAWAAAFWADPEAGCHDEALDALRRTGPAPLGPSPSASGGVLTGDGRVPRAVQQLLESISAPAPRVVFQGPWLDDATADAFEPVRAAVEGCVTDRVSGEVRLLGAIGPTGVVRLGAIDGDPAIAKCVSGLDDVELSPTPAARPLDLTLLVDRG